MFYVQPQSHVLNSALDSFLDAVRLDLTTKTSQLLLHINTPVPVWYSGGQFSNLKVCSDLAVARYGHNRIVVMNLATASHVILRAERVCSSTFLEAQAHTIPSPTPF